MATILIVDDHADVRWVLSDFISRQRHEVLEARDGAEAVALYRARRPDLALVDLFMPEHDGFEAIRTLRREFPESRIIAVSSGWTIEDADGLRIARALGADVTIRKPIDLELIRTAVDGLLAA